MALERIAVLHQIYALMQVKEKDMKKILTLLLMASLTICFAKTKNVLDVVAEKGNFKTLLLALELSGLDKTLREGKKLTIFAPTDEAFKKLPTETLNTILADSELLKKVLLYHVAKSKMTAKRVLKLPGVKTLAGKYLVNFSKGGKVQLNDATILQKNIYASNGIIHTVDKVLIPNEKTPNNEIETVDFVDINSYMGLWYEVYRLPNDFQVGCTDTTATYALKRNGKVNVINKCTLENGKEKVGRATAKVVDTQTNARLKVSFVPFLQRWVLFGGDYNIIGLGQNYEYAVVGTKDRKYLWFLSRTRELNQTTLNLLKEIALGQGYNLDNLIKTPRF